MNSRALASGSPWLMSQAFGARRQRARHAAPNQILRFWCNNEQQVWRDKAQLRPRRKSLMPASAAHRHVSILSGQAGHDRGNSFGSSLISRYSPYSQRARNAGRRTQLSIPLVSQGVASCNCRRFHIDKFFCDATQSSQPHRNLRHARIR